MAKNISFLLLFLFALGSPMQGAKANSEAPEALLQHAVTGTVTGPDGMPIPGAAVVEKGTNNGVVTDFDGNFQLQVTDQDAVLIFSYIGFETREVPLSGRSELNVSLEIEIAQLDELVVVGYRAQKEKTITGAVSSIQADDIVTRRVPAVTQALQGQVAGVNITQSTGAPGDEVEVRIRGNGTIGNNNPLYVVDGVPTRDIAFLNPSAIKSISILKDASAASIYGSRAAGGVIVVETKKGIEGDGVNVNYYYGLQQVTNLPNMLNAEQYMQTVATAWENAGYDGENPYLADFGRADFADVDYLDGLFELGRTQQAEISISEGDQDKSMFLSAGYFSQDGPVVFDNDRYQRLSLRSNGQAEVSNLLRIGANLQLSYEYQDRISSKGDAPGIIRHAFLRPPIIPVYKDPSDPTYTERNPFTDLPFYVSPDQYESGKYELSQNPIALAFFTDDKARTFNTFGNVFADLDLLGDESLIFRTNLGADLSFLHNKAFRENFGDDDGGGSEIDKGLGRHNRPNGLSESRGEDVTISWNNSFIYNKEFGNSSLGALAGTEYINSRISTISASRSRFDFSQPNFRYIDFGGTEQDLWNGGIAEEWSLFSFFGSATYSYQDKYMLTANLRADASSRFSESNQWGYFPSFSAGWMLSDENFMEGVDWLSELKLRGSWGQLGNQEIPNFAFLTLYRKDADRYLINRYGNPELRWETTTQTNFGLDFGIWDNRLYGSFDYFEKTTSDILLPISLPQFIGDVSPTFLNAGEVKNSGYELGLTFRNNENALQYQFSLNFATLENLVQSLHPNLPYITGIVTRTQPGQPLNAYYGFVQEGIYQNQQQVAEHLSGTPNPSQQPGDIRFKDLNQDGIINDNDRTFIGDPNPGLMYGFNGNLSYRNFDFSFLFQGVSDVDRFNDLKKIIDYDTRPFNYTERVLNAWDGEGSTNEIPRVSFSDNGSSRISDIYVEDASYLRLKNVELGYTVEMPKNSGLQNFRVYVSGQNLFTLTDYTGLDPESTDLIDYGTYPQSLTTLFGVNISL